MHFQTVYKLYKTIIYCIFLLSGTFEWHFLKSYKKTFARTMIGYYARPLLDKQIM